MKQVKLSSIEQAIEEAKERNKLILGCIVACEQLDTVNSEDYVDWAHDAAYNLRKNLGWENS